MCVCVFVRVVFCTNRCMNVPKPSCGYAMTGQSTSKAQQRHGDSSSTDTPVEGVHAEAASLLSQPAPIYLDPSVHPINQTDKRNGKCSCVCIVDRGHNCY